MTELIRISTNVYNKEVDIKGFKPAFSTSIRYDMIRTTEDTGTKSATLPQVYWRITFQNLNVQLCNIIE